jgi:hypothetical protein
VLSATGKEISVAERPLAMPAKRHETQRESLSGWGIRWMSEIIAKIMLFAAYASILGSTFGWFGHAHMAIR